MSLVSIHGNSTIISIRDSVPVGVGISDGIIITATRIEVGDTILFGSSVPDIIRITATIIGIGNTNAITGDGIIIGGDMTVIGMGTTTANTIDGIISIAGTSIPIRYIQIITELVRVMEGAPEVFT